MNHDELIDKLFDEYQRADQRKYVDLFISGLSQHRVFLGMAALAYMRNFPKHKFCLLEDWVDGKGTEAYRKQEKLDVLDRRVVVYDNLNPDLQARVAHNFYQGIAYPCELCSGYYTEEYPPSPEMEEFWLDHGSLHCGNELFLFWLEYTNALSSWPEPKKGDYEIFQTILNCIRTAGAQENIRDVHKRIKQQPFYKTWYMDIRKQKELAKKSTEYLASEVEYKVQLILEMLGYCGILHTEQKLMPFYKYDNIPMAARSSSRSNWEPPVDFWRGINGIDQEAFAYWFGSQPYPFEIEA